MFGVDVIASFRAPLASLLPKHVAYLHRHSSTVLATPQYDYMEKSTAPAIELRRHAHLFLEVVACLRVLAHGGCARHVTRIVE